MPNNISVYKISHNGKPFRIGINGLDYNGNTFDIELTLEAFESLIKQSEKVYTNQTEVDKIYAIIKDKW